MRRLRMLGLVFVSSGAVFLGGLGLLGPQRALAGSSWHSDPPAKLTTTGLFKDLNAYGNYGALDGAADILYSTEFDSWHFDVSGDPSPVGDALLSVSLVLDDHYDRPESEYVGRIEINGVEVFSGRFVDLGVHHGSPFGSRFRNWKMASFIFFNSEPETVTVSIFNDTVGSIGDDWLAVDSMRLALGS